MRTLVLTLAAALMLSAPAAARTGGKRSETGLLGQMNDVRAQYGLAPLTLDPRLERAARAHSRDMVASNVFDHGDFANRMLQFDVTGGPIKPSRLLDISRPRLAREPGAPSEPPAAVVHARRHRRRRRAVPGVRARPRGHRRLRQLSATRGRARRVARSASRDARRRARRGSPARGARARAARAPPG